MNSHTTAAPTPPSQGSAPKVYLLDDLVLVGELVDSLVRSGVIEKGADAHWTVKGLTAANLAAELPALESAVKEAGIVIPANVESVLRSLSVLLPMFK